MGTPEDPGWTTGWAADGAFHFPVRVYYEDTDAAGIVYFANYLKYGERARTEMLRVMNVDATRMKADLGLTLVVRGVEVDYRMPARLDDALTVVSRLTYVGGASASAIQDVYRGDTLLVASRVRVACIRDDGRPARFPPNIRHNLEERLNRTEGKGH